MRCPFCDSEQVELVSAWGGQIITSQVRCRRCGTYFEAVRDDFDGAADAAGDATEDARDRGATSDPIGGPDRLLGMA